MLRDLLMTKDDLSVVMTTDAVGGIWTYSIDLGRELVRKGMTVRLAVFGPGPDVEKQAIAAEAGLGLSMMNLPPEWLAPDAAEVARAGDALAELCRREKADILHLNQPSLAGQTRFDVPVVAACHSCLATWWEAVKSTPMPDDFRWRTDLVGRGYRSAQALVAPSRAFAEATQRVYGLDREPSVVHNGRAPDPVAPRTGPPIEAVFTAGRLWDEGKNAATLDRVAALTTAPFRAAGPTAGPNGTHIDLPHLELLGSLSEEAMRHHLSENPVYVSAARYEPFGLAILEAAQAGCALVLSDIDSFRELWDEAALFVRPDDEEGFAAAVGRLLSDPDLRADYAHAAQNRSRVYGLDAFADEMTLVYKDLMAGTRDKDHAA